MRPRLGRILLAAITIPLALITLLGLAPLPFLPPSIQASIGTISQFLIQLVTVVGAIAVIIGVLNLLRVHLRKLRQVPQVVYSAVTLITFVVVIGVHLLERLSILKPPTGAPTDVPYFSLTLMDTLQVTIESALAGILVFFLVYSAYRLMRRRATLWNTLFLISLLIVLLGFIPLPGMEFLATARDWIIRVPVAAGTRGLLIGVAIGTITVGIRVLVGQDRAAH